MNSRCRSAEQIADEAVLLADSRILGLPELTLTLNLFSRVVAGSQMKMNNKVPIQSLMRIIKIIIRQAGATH